MMYTLHLLNGRTQTVRADSAKQAEALGATFGSPVVEVRVCEPSVILTDLCPSAPFIPDEEVGPYPPGDLRYLPRRDNW